MKETLSITLDGLQTEPEVIMAFDRALKRHSYATPSWNGFKDNLRSLDSDAPFWVELIRKNPEYTALHLVITGAHLFRERAPADYATLNTILDGLTDPKERYDSVIFSYEIHD